MIASVHALAMSGPPQSDYQMAPANAAASIEAVPATVQVLRISAKQFEFIPSTFTVKKGMPVRVILTSQDVTHGFAIDQFKVNVKVEKGNDTIVDFTPDKAGTFDFYCSIFCGIGHGGMRGQMIVE